MEDFSVVFNLSIMFLQINIPETLMLDQTKAKLYWKVELQEH